MPAALSAVAAMACALASARRLAFAVAPTPLDPALLGRSLEDDRGFALARSLGEVLAGGGLAWEGDLFAAWVEPSRPLREARLGEQLTELDGLVRRWARVPRVCASVSTSVGFLLATVAVLHGLGGPLQPADGSGAPQGVLLSAVDALALGIAGASFCLAVHVRAGRAVRARLAGADHLVARLQALRPLAGPLPV